MHRKQHHEKYFPLVHTELVKHAKIILPSELNPCRLENKVHQDGWKLLHLLQYDYDKHQTSGTNKQYMIHYGRRD